MEKAMSWRIALIGKVEKIRQKLTEIEVVPGYLDQVAIVKELIYKEMSRLRPHHKWVEIRAEGMIQDNQESIKVEIRTREIIE